MNEVYSNFLFLALVSCGAPETPKAYVTSQKGGISVIDIESKQVINDIDIQSSGPRGIGISQDGKYLITANKGDANLSIIDRESGKLFLMLRLVKILNSFECLGI